MDVLLFNTLSRQKHVFRPRTGNEVALYTCGPTVYGTAHIGNLRTYIFEDILRRVLALNSFSVKHVMNITDVGHLTGDSDMGQDKMEESARREHKSAYDIAAFHTAEFFTDLERLNILPPTKILKATDTIDLQIAFIKKLEANGHTYRITDGIYFDTTTSASYGKLSGQSLSEKKAGARIEENSEKKQPTDFALWKFSPVGEKRQMEWDSPWGVGFPGWHIECSAMSVSEFPHGLDIHCGGIDHIAVHHENELAQNDGAGYPDFVRVWMHGEFLVLPEARMGKSEGNSITLADVIAKGIHPLAYRYLCLQAHYRKQLSFTWESLEAAQRGLEQLWREVDMLADQERQSPKSTETNNGEGFLGIFVANVNDDLNTASVLSLTQDVIASQLSPKEKRELLARFDEVLGLGLTPDTPLRPHIQFSAIPVAVQALIDSRAKARQEKNWAESDRLRGEIEAAGYRVEDAASGSTYHARRLQ